MEKFIRTNSNNSVADRTIAIARVLTGAIFVLFGEYKVAGTAFARGGFQQQWLASFINHDAVSFYRPFLVHVVQPHAVFFGYFVGVGELLIGLSLISGLWVRPASVFGAIHMISLILATWNQVGPGPVWRYFGAELDHIPLLFLFAIFFTTCAGETWGLDAQRPFQLGRRKAHA